MKPTIEITCWHCKRYDAYYCRCRKSKREIMWEDAHNAYCFDWASSKKSVSIELCDFASNQHLNPRKKRLKWKSVL